MENIRFEYCDVSGLIKLARAHPENRFLLERPENRDRTSDTPLPFFRLRNNGPFGRNGLYLTALTDENLVAGGIIYDVCEKNEDIYWRKDATLSLGALSIRAEFRNRHIGTTLLQMIFEKAAAEKRLLKIGSFVSVDNKALSEKYVAPALPRIHTRFPDLRVLYRNESQPVTGEKPYFLDFTRSDYRVKFPDSLECAA